MALARHRVRVDAIPPGKIGIGIQSVPQRGNGSLQIILIRHPPR